MVFAIKSDYRAAEYSCVNAFQSPDLFGQAIFVRKMNQDEASFMEAGRASEPLQQLKFEFVIKRGIEEYNIESGFIAHSKSFRRHCATKKRRFGDSRILQQNREFFSVFFNAHNRLCAPGCSFEPDNSGTRKKIAKGKTGQVAKHRKYRFTHPIHGWADFEIALRHFDDSAAIQSTCDAHLQLPVFKPEIAPDFAIDIAGFYIRTLVEFLFAAAQAQLKFQKAMLQIYAEGYERIAFFPNPTVYALDFLPMKKKLFRAIWIMAEHGSLSVLRNMEIVEPDFLAFYFSKRIAEAYAPFFDRFYFAALERDAAFNIFLDFIIETGAAILSDYFYRNLGSHFFLNAGRNPRNSEPWAAGTGPLESIEI